MATRKVIKQTVEEVEVEFPMYVEYVNDSDWQIKLIDDNTLISVHLDREIQKQGIVDSYLNDEKFTPSTEKEFIDVYSKTVEYLEQLVVNSIEVNQ
jgi:hypothetical protein